MTTACRGRRTPPPMNEPNLGMARTGATHKPSPFKSRLRIGAAPTDRQGLPTGKPWRPANLGARTVARLSGRVSEPPPELWEGRAAQHRGTKA